MSKEGTTENNSKGNKGKLWAILIILVLLIGGGVYYYFDAQQKKINAVFEQLKQQGVVFKEWKKNSDNTYSLVEPKLQVADNMQLNVENIQVAIKDDNLLDIKLNNIVYKNDIVAVTLPAIAITGYKINEQVFDERLKGKMRPFSLHLLSNDFKSMVFDNWAVKLNFAIEDVKVAAELGMDKSQLVDYYNGIAAKYINDGYKLSLNFNLGSSAASLVKQVTTVEHMEVADVNLRLQTLMSYLADDKPDQPFQKISGAYTLKNYQNDMTSSGKAEDHMSIEEMTTDGFSMRYGKKAPVETINNLVVLATSLFEAKQKGEKIDVDYPKLLALTRDALYMVDMVGPFEQVGTNINSQQNQDGMNMFFNVDEIAVRYDYLKTSLHYKGLDLAAAMPMLGEKPFMEVKLGLLNMEGVDFSSLYHFAMAELDKVSKLDALPDSNTYFMSLFANAPKIYPKIDKIELKNVALSMPISEVDVKFDEISLKNKYAKDGPIPTSLDLNVVNYSQYIPDPKYYLPVVGIEDGKLVVSSRIKADYDETQKQILLRDSFFENNASGRVDISATIGQVQPYLFSGNMIEMAAAATGLTVKDFKIDIDEKGQLAIFKENIAEEEDVSAQEFGYFLISDLVRVLQNLITDEDIRASVLAPMAKFINNGGVISIDAKSKTNFGVAMTSFAMLDLRNNLDGLWSLFNITVSVK